MTRLWQRDAVSNSRVPLLLSSSNPHVKDDTARRELYVFAAKLNSGEAPLPADGQLQSYVANIFKTLDDRTIQEKTRHAFASVALALIRTRSLLDGADKLMLPGARVLGSIIAQDNFALKVIAGLILRVVISQNLLPAKLCWPYDFPGDRLPSCRFPTQDNDVWLECFQTFLSRFQKHYTIEQESHIKIFPSKAVIGQSAIYGPFALYVKDTSLIFVTAPSHGIPELIEVLKSRILAVGFNPSQVIHDKVIESYPINKTDPSVIVNIVDLYTRNFESRRDTQLKFITDSDAHASALSTQLSLLLRPKMSTSQILDLSQEPVPLDKASDKISPEPDASSDNSITWKAKAMLLAQQPHTDREREDHPDAEEKQLAEDGLPQANGDESQISGSDCAADGLEANPPVQRAEAEREPQVDMNAGTTLAEEDQLPQVPGDTSQPADSGRAASRLAERKVALSSAPVKLAKTNKSTSAYIWEMSTHKGLAKSAQKMPNTLEVHHTPPAPTVASSKPAIKLKAQMQSTEDPSDRPSTGTLATTTSRAKTKVTTKTTPNATKAADPFELPDSPSDEHSNNSLPVKRGQGKKNRKVAAATQSKADKTKKKGRQARKKTEQDSDSSSPDPINQSEYHPSQKVTTVNTSKKPATRAAAAAASNESNNRQSFLGPRPSAKTQSESVVVAPQSDQSKAKISQKKLHEVPEDHADSKVKAGTSQDNAMEISSDESEENVETPKDEAVDGEPQPAVVSGDGDFQNIDELEARFLDQETEVMLPLPMQVQSTLPQHAKPTTQKLRRQAQVPQSSAAEELLGSLIDENQAKKTSFIRFGRQGPENQGASALPKATTPGASSVSISTKTTSRPLQQMPSGMLLSSLRNASAKARPCLSQNAPAMGTRPKVLKNISNGQGHKRPNDDLTTMLAGSKRYRSSRRVRETTPTPFTGADDLPMLASSPPHEGTLAQAQDADTVPLAQGLKICSLRLDIAAVVPSATVVQQQQDRDSTPTPVGSRVTFSDPIVPEEVVPNRRGATNVAERNVQAPHNAGRAPRALKIQHSAQPHPKQSQSVFSSNTKLVPSDPRAPSRIMTGPAVMQEVDHVNDILRPPVENGDPFSSPTDGMSKKTTFLRELETRVREDQPMEREDEDGGPEQRDDPKSTPSSRSSGSSDPSTPPDDEFIDEEIADVGESPWANRLEPHARPVYRALRSGAQAMATAMSAAEEQSIREIVNAYRTDGTTVVEAFEQYRRKQFRRIHSEISREHQAFLNLAETKLRADLNIVKECSTAGKFRSYKLAVEGEFTSLEEWCEQLSA